MGLWTFVGLPYCSIPIHLKGATPLDYKPLVFQVDFAYYYTVFCYGQVSRAEFLATGLI